MRILPIQAFRTALTKKTGLSRPSIGALDVGRKHIGLALVPLFTTQISPLGSVEVHRHQEVLHGRSLISYDKVSQRIQKYINQEEIIGLVIGFPLGPNNEITPLCHEIYQLIEHLHCYQPLSNRRLLQEEEEEREEMLCTFWDERNSTVGARRLVKDMMLSSRRTVMLKYKDSLAASLILQGFLEHGNGNGTGADR
eukprot:gene10997-12244_t